RSVVLQASGFGDGLNTYARLAPELSLEIAVLHLDHGDGVHTDEGVHAGAVGILGGNAVNGDVVLSCASAIGIESGTAVKTLALRALIHHHPGQEGNQRGEITVDHRQVLHLLAGDDSGAFAARGLNRGALGLDHYFLSDRAYRKLDLPKGKAIVG